MKPAFALHLSFDGIRLVHRGKRGWHEVGHTALDAPDLAETLRMFRRTATELEPSGLATVLVIPDDQILYTQLELDKPTEAQVRLALDGRTPYQLDELVFDWKTAAPGRVAVAVVARQTLDEAEDFAAKHKFNPCAFTASPGAQAGFPGEPWFGASRLSRTILSAGEVVEQDDVPLRTASGYVEPSTPPEPVAHQSEQEDGSENVLPEVQGIAPGGQSETGSGEALRDTGTDDTPPQRAAHAEVAEVIGPEPELARTEAKPVPSIDSNITANTPVAFATRRAMADGGTDELPNDTEPTPVVASVPHRIQGLGVPDAPPPKPSPETVSGITLGVLPPEGPPSPPGGTTDGATDSQPSGGPAPAGKAATQRGTKSPRPAGRPSSVVVPLPKAPAARAPGHRPQGSAAVRPAVAPFAMARNARALPAVSRLAELPEDSPPRTESFTPRPADVREPRRLPIPLTMAIALVAALALAAAAGLSILVLGQDEGPVPPEMAVAQTTITQGDPLPSEAAPTAPADASADAGSVSEFVTPDPDLVMDDPEAIADGEVTLALADPVFETDMADPVTLDETLPSSRADTAPGPNLPAAPLPEAATNTLAFTDAFVIPPQPAVPGTLDAGLNSLYIASIDPSVAVKDAVALATPETRHGLPPTIASVPAPPGSSFVMDDRGLVEPTAQGSLTPDGVLVFAGRPAVVAPPRPVRSLPSDIEVPTATDNRLAGLRPRPRPDDLLETNEAARLGGFTRAELAMIRPPARPDRPDPAQAAALALATATPRAVSTSQVPRGRPANFDALVAALSVRVDPIPQAAAPAATAPSTTGTARSTPLQEDDGEPEIASSGPPPTPSAANVAKQATIDNALNLREINLIGVYGSSSDRRALVRLSNGRFVKVKVGDRIDGGRVASIGDRDLRYEKGGRSLTLQMPRGG